MQQNRRNAEALDAFKIAAAAGGVRNWMAAGMLLASEHKIEEALTCLINALDQAPDSDEVLDALITTLFNAGRHQEGILFARHQLGISKNYRFLSHAALLLQSNNLYEEAANAFKIIAAAAGDDPTVLGAALIPSRFTCEWEWIDSLQERICACYGEGNFGAPQEYALTHVTWCTNEKYNLNVTQSYLARAVPSSPPKTGQPSRHGSRIRVGYLSGDFYNHATMHLMAGLFESHDQSRFEIFAYDYSRGDDSEYRQRFLNSVEHHVEIHALSDEQAASRIAEDHLDILFDLKGHTGWSRFPILAYRPASLQVAYLGYPGSAASNHIDYIVSDRFVTPDSSAPFYTEKFCRLPHSYQCNDSKRPVATESGPRVAHHLPDNKVVFSAFNQSYKIDRTSFAVWMKVLEAVPNSVLWLLKQSDVAQRNLCRFAQLAGIAPTRLIFAPFATSQEHLARLQLADAALDTLVCNGHTTTSDALWASLPVITAQGTHFASRVSESLLNAMNLPELVGVDHDDMINIAKRIGIDHEYRQSIRQKIHVNRTSAPLFDTQRFTKNFELAIEMMVEAHRGSGQKHHIDVPDCRGG
ncbi:hypothetical protein ACA087_06300 [Pseudomonas chlororaphis]|uniref:O-linked N-acetylglucosamine transferase, SPINDLY family protein n=1 Tax=Pseudomonas chlororaphis TaxID=587753 RepID=UPI00352AA03B